MVFSSSTFMFLFLPAFFMLYYLVPFKAKNIVLCIFSLIFYAWGEPVYIGLMIFSSVVDFCNGLCMEKFKKYKMIFLIISIVINLSLLGFFKYSAMIVNSINEVFGMTIKVPNLALPIGISFYTFQTMSYSIDVYRGEVKTEHHFLDFMAYVSMFPQLIAGPIVRYSTINEELHNRVINFETFSNGMYRFLIGLFKKVMIANSVGALFTSVSASNVENQSALTLWVAILAFSLQIYFDFSGYTDMAIGIGRMLGFTFPENFKYPYQAETISEFWRRWHMSLTTWFRDYVYIPLGGSRRGAIRTIINIVVVWALTGIWHGAEWNFMLWGVYFGILLIIEKFILKDLLTKTPAVIKHIYVCVLVMIGWVIFSFEKLSDIAAYIKGMFHFENFIDNKALFLIGEYKVILILAMLFSVPVIPFIKRKIAENIKNRVLLNAIYIFITIVFIVLLILSIAMIISESYNPFLYFRF